MTMHAQDISQMKISQIEPKKDIVRLTEMVLEQNIKILDMNARLLAVLSSPAFVVGERSEH